LVVVFCVFVSIKGIKFVISHSPLVSQICRSLTLLIIGYM